MAPASLLFFYFIHIVFGQETAVNDPTINRTNTNDDTSSYVANSINEFGYRIITKMIEQEPDKNIIISSTSLAGVLAMALLGTVGTTYAELASALGFSQDVLQNRNNHYKLGELFQSLNGSSNQTKTLYADSIFVDNKLKLRAEYKNYVSSVYKGEIFNNDFRKKLEVKNNINEWVNRQTFGKIDNFLQEPLPIDTSVVLLSALYFSGQWEHPFLPEYTASLPFQTPTEEVAVEQMLNAGDCNYVYSKEHDFHMIALPYNDSTTTMYVLMPRILRRQNLTQLMNHLTHEIIDSEINKMHKDNCIIRFPKLDIKSNVDLKNSLNSLGIKSIFSPSAANFALMIQNDEYSNTKKNASLPELLESLPNPGIYVDSVLHDVRLTINEYGTEAVAATIATTKRTASLFYANSPFYMFIRNEKTKLVIFNAVIFNPKL